jgi:RHS repeat-associated protein
MGNPSQMLDASGGILSSNLFDAFGLRVAYTGVSDAGGPFAGFGAQWGNYKDVETGFSLLGYRYYDPLYAVYLTRDPIGYNGGINLYSYVANNPINFIDPMGLSYAGDVGQVFLGYWDAINPVNMYNGLKSLADIASDCGMGAALGALGNGLKHGFTDWMTTSDPRAFGQSFGSTLLAAAGRYVPIAEGAAAAEVGVAGAAEVTVFRAPMPYEVAELESSGSFVGPFGKQLHVTTDPAYADVYAQQYGTTVWQTTIPESLYNTMVQRGFVWQDPGAFGVPGEVIQATYGFSEHAPFFTGWGKVLP